MYSFKICNDKHNHWVYLLIVFKERVVYGDRKFKSLIKKTLGTLPCFFSCLNTCFQMTFLSEIPTFLPRYSEIIRCKKNIQIKDQAFHRSSDHRQKEYGLKLKLFFNTVDCQWENKQKRVSSYFQRRSCQMLSESSVYMHGIYGLTSRYKSGKPGNLREPFMLI